VAVSLPLTSSTIRDPKTCVAPIDRSSLCIILKTPLAKSPSISVRRESSNGLPGVEMIPLARSSIENSMSRVSFSVRNCSISSGSSIINVSMIVSLVYRKITSLPCEGISTKIRGLCYCAEVYKGAWCS
jgi:hypothetical protein